MEKMPCKFSKATSKNANNRFQATSALTRRRA